MATQEHPEKFLNYFDLSGGMDAQTSKIFIKNNECELIQNYHLDSVGSLTKRNGIAYLIGQTVDNMNILNMFYFKDSQGTDYSNVLVAVNPTGAATSVIKKISSNAWANSQTGNIASAIPYFTTFIDYLFRTNGSDAMASSADLSMASTGIFAFKTILSKLASSIVTGLLIFPSLTISILPRSTVSLAKPMALLIPGLAASVGNNDVAVYPRRQAPPYSV